jgi:ABC-type transporter MlaC component
MMSAGSFLSRRVAILAIASAALLSFSAPARADEAAESFIRGILGETNVIFETNDEQSRLDGIEKLVDKYVDMKRVSMFVLGQYARQITDAQKEEYLPLFRRYATLIYQEVLSDYSGEALEVVDSVDRSPRDIIVNSRVADAKPGDKFADTIIHWRVYRDSDGKMSVFDAGANGVWLAIEQQSQFKSVIANNGGGAAGIDALIADLKKKLSE